MKKGGIILLAAVFAFCFGEALAQGEETADGSGTYLQSILGDKPLKRVVPIPALKMREVTAEKRVDQMALSPVTEPKKIEPARITDAPPKSKEQAAHPVELASAFPSIQFEIPEPSPRGVDIPKTVSEEKRNGSTTPVPSVTLQSGPAQKAFPHFPVIYLIIAAGGVFSIIIPTILLRKKLPKDPNFDAESSEVVESSEPMQLEQGAEENLKKPIDPSTGKGSSVANGIEKSLALQSVASQAFETPNFAPESDAFVEPVQQQVERNVEKILDRQKSLFEDSVARNRSMYVLQVRQEIEKLREIFSVTKALPSSGPLDEHVEALIKGQQTIMLRLDSIEANIGKPASISTAGEDVEIPLDDLMKEVADSACASEILREFASSPLEASNNSSQV